MLFRNLGVFGGRKQTTVLTPSEIFGANYYDDWDFNNAGSLSLTGSLINSVSSLTGSGRNFTSSGGARPTLTADATLGKNVATFDGLATFMTVPSSTTLYKFLHYGQGCIISIWKTTNATATRVLISSSGSSATTGVLDTVAATNVFNFQVFLSSSGNAIASQQAISTNQYNYSVKINDTENTTVLDKVYNYYNGTINKSNTGNFTGNNVNSAFDLHLGRYPLSAALYWQGTVSRIIVLNTIPSSKQLQQLNSYINSVYGTFPIS